ncbi:MAG TPA: hypothetical protein EYO59_07865, partial [Chromatiaceae bacterium]|nr:hypothetical protein [Chromatiaceae bacterium]
GALRMLPIETIKPNPEQPRKEFEPVALSELAASISKHGIIQPLVVRRKGQEAAAQGLMAGLNAYRYMAKMEIAVLDRHEAYIGVLIDDLVTRGVDEPYRIFTSRAEHRLTLRESNAEERLLDKAIAWDLLPEERRLAALGRRDNAYGLKQWLDSTKVGAKLARELGLTPELHQGLTRSLLLRRPEIGLSDVMFEHPQGLVYSVELRWVEEQIKFYGYIQRERVHIERLGELESFRLPTNMNYLNMSGLSAELREKLNALKPISLGQASRVQGMTPVALTLLRCNSLSGKHNSSVFA